MVVLRRPKISFNSNLLLAIAALTLVYFTFFWQIGTLVPGMSGPEAQTKIISQSLHSIQHNPANGLHAVLLYLFNKAGLTTIAGARLVSAALATIFTFCFYKVTKTWFGSFIAWASTALFAMTPLLILSARSITPEIMYLMPLAVGATYFWLTKGEKPSTLAYVSLIIVGALSLYTPGMVWLIIIGLVAIRSRIKPIYRSFPRRVTALGLILALLIIAPLVVEVAKSFSLARELLLIPSSFHALTPLKDIGWAGLAIFWHSQSHNTLQVGRLPLINATQIAFTVFGAYALWLRARNKTYGFIAVIVFGVLGVGLSGDYGLLLLPLISTSILCAAGLRYLYIEWQGIFPRNPLPRVFAIVLLYTLVAININYGLHYSLAAWPHTVATKSTYVIK